ncbi:unnamed protein product, partial [Rhizoctonia solani]
MCLPCLPPPSHLLAVPHAVAACVLVTCASRPPSLYLSDLVLRPNFYRYGHGIPLCCLYAYLLTSLAPRMYIVFFPPHSLEFRLTPQLCVYDTIAFERWQATSTGDVCLQRRWEHLVE